MKLLLVVAPLLPSLASGFIVPSPHQLPARRACKAPPSKLQAVIDPASLEALDTATATFLTDFIPLLTAAVADFQDELPKISIGDAKELLDSFPKVEVPRGLLDSLQSLNLPKLPESLPEVKLPDLPEVPPQLQGALKAAQEATPGAIDSLKGFASGVKGTYESLKSGGGVSLPSLPSIDLKSVPVPDSVKEQLGAIQDQVGGAVGGKVSELAGTVNEQVGKFLQPYQPLIDQTKGQLGERFSVVSKLADQVTKEVSKDTENLAPAFGVLKTVGTPRNLFNTENLIALPFWAAVILAPSNGLVRAVMSSYLPILAGVFAYMWGVYLAFQDPVSLEGFSGITDLTALTKGFSSETSVAVAWAHFICQDLFVGRWIYLDGMRNGVWTSHSLALTFLFGPTGILSHLLTRGFVKIFRWDVEDIFSAGSKAVAPSAADGVAREMVKDAEKQSKSLLRSADKQAGQVVNTAKAEARKILTQARREAEQALGNEGKIKANAEAQADRIIKEAQKKADAMLAKASASASAPSPPEKVTVDPAPQSE